MIEIKRIFYGIVVSSFLFSGCNIGKIEQESSVDEIVKKDFIQKLHTPEVVEKIIPVKKDSANNNISTPYLVVSVADGDTISVVKKGESLKSKVTVRILGLDTPEKYKTRTGYVECYGEEASEYAKKLLLNKTVYLEFDDSQDKQDRYGRLLAHVFLENNENYQAKVIKNGYGFSYVYKHKTKYFDLYSDSEKKAKLSNLGVWKYCDGKRIPKK